MVVSRRCARDEMMTRVGQALCYGLTRDVSVESPLSLVRVTGSTHAETGLKKVTFDANQFRKMTLEQVFATVDSYYSGFQFPDPTAGQAMEDPLTRFNGMAQYASIKLYDE